MNKKAHKSVSKAPVFRIFAQYIVLWGRGQHYFKNFVKKAWNNIQNYDIMIKLKIGLLSVIMSAHRKNALLRVCGTGEFQYENE